jgi:hypothetical protein
MQSDYDGERGAMIDFPANPTVGQQFTAAGVTWVWDGVKWSASGLSVAYVPLAGFVPAMNDNRIINGDMRVDARNNGAAGSAINVYTVDRWLFSASAAGHLTWGRGASVLAGFPYQLNAASTSAYAVVAADYFVLQQSIEADAISDFAWGTANAQPIALSFWAQSSLTGTFGGSIQNYANNRSYPFSFSLPVASTWTKIIIPIPGDTAGTWVLSGNGGALTLSFSLGMGATRSGPANAWASTNYLSVPGAVSIVGTNGANLGVTGVKLEVGSVATAFNRQSLAKSLADCQRYYQQFSIQAQTFGGGAGNFNYSFYFPPMRANPTGNLSGLSYGNATAAAYAALTAQSSVITITQSAAGYAFANGTVALSAEL